MTGGLLFAVVTIAAIGAAVIRLRIAARRLFDRQDPRDAG